MDQEAFPIHQASGQAQPCRSAASRDLQAAAMVPFRYGHRTSGVQCGMPDESLPKPTEDASPAANPRAGSELSGAVIQDSNAMPTIPASTPPPPPLPMQAEPGGRAPHRIPYWLQQTERFLRVIVRMYLGLLVCCAPWYPPAWDNNPLFSSSPSLQAFVTQGAVRGIVSGLGLLNLWIAIRDAMRGPAGR